jgi:hypothetical protein
MRYGSGCNKEGYGKWQAVRDGSGGRCRGAGGVEVRPYLSPVPRARNCWEAPGTFWVRGLGCGGEPGAVGTRGGVGAPPTAYQPLWARGR